jgi:hypothetical protein
LSVSARSGQVVAIVGRTAWANVAAARLGGLHPHTGVISVETLHGRTSDGLPNPDLLLLDATVRGLVLYRLTTIRHGPLGVLMETLGFATYQSSRRFS